MKPTLALVVNMLFALPLSPLLLAADGAPPPAESRITQPTDTTRQVTRAVASLVPELHLTHRLLDEDVSRRWLDLFLLSLDPDKHYFMQSDIERFRKQQNDLGRLAKQGDASVAYEVYKVFLQRAATVIPWALEFAAAPHDFSADEEVIIDPDSAPYVADAAAAREHWRKRVKHDLLMLRLAGVDDQQARDRLARRYQLILQRARQVTDDELLEYYLTALGNAYDPLTTYMAPATVETFNATNREQLEGIGAALRSVDGETRIVTVLPGGPAAKDGRLKKGDRIVAVGEGEGGRMVDVTKLPLSEVIKLVRGKGGSLIRLQIAAQGQAEARTLSLIRGKVQTAEARAAIAQAGRKPDGSPYKIGVIRVPSFYSSGFTGGTGVSKTVTADMRRIFEDPQRGFRAAAVDAVVIDLRNNTGGVLTEAVHLPGLFNGKGATVQIKTRDGTVHSYASEQGAVWDGPLVVVINRHTASGAEIFAAAIQDCGRGLVVGDSRTNGVGTVQSLVDIGRKLVPKGDAPKLGVLKHTSEQFYRVNGDSVQAQGIAADVVLPSLLDQQKIGAAYLPYALPFDRIDRVNHPTFNPLTAADKSALQSLSDKRREASADFRRLADEIARLKARLQRKTFPLAEAKARQVHVEAEDDAALASDPVVGNNFYDNELLTITVDYLESLKRRAPANRPQ